MEWLVCRQAGGRESRLRSAFPDLACALVYGVWRLEACWRNRRGRENGHGQLSDQPAQAPACAPTRPTQNEQLTCKVIVTTLDDVHIKSQRKSDIFYFDQCDKHRRRLFTY